MNPERVETNVDGRRITISNLDKVLYPESGFTKGQVLDYYARIADVMLPHLQNRPVTLKRFPNGVEENPSTRNTPRPIYPTGFAPPTYHQQTIRARPLNSWWCAIEQR